MEPEPFVGLTELLASQPCDWKDVLDFVGLVRDLGQSMTPRKGLGERLRGKAIALGAPGRAARLVALELAKAYNGMLVEGGHTVDLASPELPMKLLTECTVLRPTLLPVDEAQDQSWAAQVPQGGTVKYPAVLLGGARNAQSGARTVVLLRMHRFVCWLARGPPAEADHEVCHACSNTACVRPSHLRWGTHQQNMREKTHRRRRR